MLSAIAKRRNLESVIQTVPNDVSFRVSDKMGCAAEMHTSAAKVLFGERVTEIFAFDRPVAADHAFAAAACRPSPIKILSAGVEHFNPAQSIAVVDHIGPVIDRNATASRVKQPFVPREPDATFERRVKIAAGLTIRARIETDVPVVCQIVAIQVHITEVELRPHHQPAPLPVISKLSADDESGFIIAPCRSVGQLVTVDVSVMTAPKLCAAVDTNIKARPIALRRGSRSDLSHFLARGNRFGVRVRHRGQKSDGNETNERNAQGFHALSFVMTGSNVNPDGPARIAQKLRPAG